VTDDSPTAVLTKGQREYLKGEKEPAQERTLRARIRDRIEAGLSDFGLLTTNLSADDRSQLREATSGQLLGERVSLTVAFLFQLIDDAEKFEFLVERGILTGLAEAGERGAEVDVSIDIRYADDLDQLVEKVDRGADLTEREFTKLAFASSEEFTDKQIETLQDAPQEEVRKWFSTGNYSDRAR